MRIIQVVTLLSPDGRFGGPSRVALDQARELLRVGHSVTVFAASVDYPEDTKEVEGVPVQLFPAKMHLPSRFGFASMTAPGLRKALRLASGEADVLHIHMARDLTTLGAALTAARSSVPYVLQTHGMIDYSVRFSAKVIDLLATRRATRSASTVFALSADERTELLRLTRGRVAVELLRNGIAASEALPSVARSRVLFLSRLHPRKGGRAFASASLALTHEFPSVLFTIAGPDEGDLTGIEALLNASGRANTIEVIGAVPPGRVAELMASALVFVMPAPAEPFGMTLLEAMTQGTPVILSSSAALAPTIVGAGAGVMFDERPGDLIAAIRKVIGNPELQELMGRKARELVRSEFAIESVVSRLVEAYRAAAVEEPVSGADLWHRPTASKRRKGEAREGGD